MFQSVGKRFEPFQKIPVKLNEKERGSEGAESAQLAGSGFLAALRGAPGAARFGGWCPPGQLQLQAWEREDHPLSNQMGDGHVVSLFPYTHARAFISCMSMSVWQ
jgi:hypothetical protein